VSSEVHTEVNAAATVARGPYNAAVDLLFSNLHANRGQKIAICDDAGEYSYAELARRVQRFSRALSSLGIEREQRILLCLTDSIDFPTAFLGAIYAGVVPVPVNTLLMPADYEFMLDDSRARLVVISAGLLPAFEASLKKRVNLHIFVSGEASTSYRPFSDLLAGEPMVAAANTHADEPCFWLYSSGSTGVPKGTIHAHRSAMLTASLYAHAVLGMQENDVVFSAAKLFFAYGLGNSLTFPLSVGATAILVAERPTPACVARVLKTHQPTIFCGVPTLYNAMLASPELPERRQKRLRLCISAGEALPQQTAARWKAHFGVDILDGLGSTEMLHIFLSNRPGDVRLGSTGLPVPGYDIRLVDEQGAPVRQGEIGELQVHGPTSAIGYWNNRERSQETFLGPWTRSGDKYFQDPEGYFVYCGRTDDMLKVGGIYVAPFEVEAALGAHEKVLEAAVVGHPDEAGLIKPKAFIVLRAGVDPSETLVGELQAFVRTRLAAYKYPRWIEFMPELPKTATGKIQRYKLRDSKR